MTRITSSSRLSRREFLKLAGLGLPAATLLGGCKQPSESPGALETPRVEVLATPSGTCPEPSRRSREGALEPPGTMTPRVEESATPSGTCPEPSQRGREGALEPPTGRAVNLEVKIGQMLLIGFRGLELSEDHPIIQDIRERHLGGIVLFDYDVPNKEAVRNVESPSQLKALTQALQTASAIPLLIAIDHEGGVITRLKEEFGFPPTVSHQYLGDTDNLTITYSQASAMAKTLAELGINLNLAPVVDLNTSLRNPIIARYERSFSADPEVVTRHALEFIRAHHERGLLCTLKHFPGHGSSSGDSHRGLIDVSDTWSPIELEPYANIIKAGLADAIMTAHVFNAHLDPEYPATLSSLTINGLLRGELQYAGVVISDDMQMGAIANHYGFEAAIQKTIEAGVDIITIANNSVYVEDVATQAVALIKQLVREGKISEARIEQSYQRIQGLKSGLQ